MEYKETGIENEEEITIEQAETVEQMDSIASRIIRDMNEGVIVVGNDGRILLANKRAQEILDKKAEELEGKPFAKPFYAHRLNDEFNQTILDAVYDNKKVHKNVVKYHAGDTVKYLKVITSGLRSEDKTVGVIAVLTDITELTEVKEHLKMMNEIEKLNKTLEKKNEFIRKAFSRYLSDEIVEQILDRPDGMSLGGELRNVTVLMSDLRGFTMLCEEMGPRELMQMLNHYFDAMSQIIRMLNGTIIEYAGDGILAVFGAPIKGGNHALFAVVAALKMQQVMLEVNKWNRDHGFPKLDMGIGINTGDAVVGNMGSEYAMKYNIIGGCVNLCGRIEGYTVGGQIYVSPYTMELINEELLVDDVISVKPKGLKEPFSVSSVYGIGEPYNIVLPTTSSNVALLKKPIRIVLSVLEGKRVTDEEFEGEITATGDGKLLITTSCELFRFDNILIKSERETYAKIIGQRDDGYLAAVTAGYAF